MRLRTMILERMASFAVRDMAERILDSALERVGIAFVPIASARLTAFAHGPLQELVRHHLGDDAADALLDDLRPLIAMTAADEEEISSIRPRTDSGPIDMPVGKTDVTSQTKMRAVEGDAIDADGELDGEPHATTVRPDRALGLVVVVSSANPSRGFGLGIALGEGADVRVVDDLVELMDTLADLADRLPVLVLDGVAPALHAATLSATLPELPEGVSVVLWGYDDDALLEMRELVDKSLVFDTFGVEVSEIDLAEALRHR